MMIDEERNAFTADETSVADLENFGKSIENKFA
jgi:hypothetical protein